MKSLPSYVFIHHIIPSHQHLRPPPPLYIMWPYSLWILRCWRSSEKAQHGGSCSPSFMHIDILIPAFSFFHLQSSAQAGFPSPLVSFASTRYAENGLMYGKTRFTSDVCSLAFFFECVGRAYAMCNIDTLSVEVSFSEAGAFVALGHGNAGEMRKVDSRWRVCDCDNKIEVGFEIQDDLRPPVGFPQPPTTLPCDCKLNALIRLQVEDCSQVSVGFPMLSATLPSSQARTMTLLTQTLGWFSCTQISPLFH